MGSTSRDSIVRVYVIESGASRPSIEELKLHLERLRETNPVIYRHIAAFIRAVST